VAITLDEQPGSISWSLDYIGRRHQGNIYPTESIASCDHCYAGDDRYTRVVVVEDFCIPTEIVGCVQLTFTAEQTLGDGAGFVAMKNGRTFASHQVGQNSTRVIVPGVCAFSCGMNEHVFEMLLLFEDRKHFPTRLSSNEEPNLWSSISQKVPYTSGPVLIQRCLKMKNEIEKFTVHRNVNGGDDGFGDGSYMVYLDGEKVASQIFDIGARQVFEIALNRSKIATSSTLAIGGESLVMTNIPAKCNTTDDKKIHNNDSSSSSSVYCDSCQVCPEDMEVNAGKTVDIIGSFESIGCSVLESLGRSNGLNDAFCDLYPADIQSICDCKLTKCGLGDVPLTVKIEFDKSPADITFIVREESGAVVWFQDFQGYSSKGIGVISSFGQCVPATGPLHFEINDAKGNGLCCNTDSDYFIAGGLNGYEVYLDDELVGKRQFPLGSHQELLLRSGEASSAVEKYQPPVWCTDDCPSCEVCRGNEVFNPNESVTLESYGTINCYDFIVDMSYFVTTEFCSANRGHVVSSCSCVNDTFECSSSNESTVRFELTFDDESVGGRDVVVEVRDEWNKTLWSKKGFASENSGAFEACIPSERRVYFVVNHHTGGGIYTGANENTSSWSSSSSGVQIGSVLIFVEDEMFARDIISEGRRYEVLYGSDYTASPAGIGPPVVSPPFSVDESSSGSNIDEIEAGPYPPCNICGEGNTITIMDPIVIIPGEDVRPTCKEFDEGAWAGHVPAELCPLTVGLVSSLCGCAAAAVPKSPSSIIQTRVAGPTVFELGPHPTCHVCGKGFDVTLFDPIVEIPEQNVSSTCSDFRDSGLNGHISAELCPWTALAVASLCGCSPERR